MTNNFRRFNSRVGVVFVFQNRLIRLLSWRTPTHTLSFLAVYTLLCLDPYLLAVLPLVILLLFVMVPSFVTRHPPPPTNLSTDSYSAYGPPVAPPPTVKPVSEMSKDFFRNMRDLQNSMEDFAQIHDKVVDLVAPPTNFSNETLSSAVFLFLFVASCILFLASHLLPWRAISLLAGWAGVCAGHPSIQRQLVSTHKDHVQPRERRTQSWVSSWIDGEIKLDSGPEMREVEVFELQRRSTADEWAGWVFSPSPHDPLSPDRVTGHRPRGTRFFEDVQAPPGWEWSDKKWTLDLLSREWVEERMITGVEIEMEGERWVYDISYDDESDETEDGTTIKGKGRRMEWEEGTGLGKTGPWRRRRWILVMVTLKVYASYHLLPLYSDEKNASVDETEEARECVESFTVGTATVLEHLSTNFESSLMAVMLVLFLPLLMPLPSSLLRTDDSTSAMTLQEIARQ
ncbi:MAG: hypothetical protein M1817_006009 [Caeruleum heppii]|nr:MAG: hypothetical protein M1817_006009 [Caeruleum heppii]